MRIYLIGFMGGGKSYISKELSRVLDYPVVDLDETIERRAGMSIVQLFKQYGEAHFRRLEQEALHSTAEESPLIIATGGGTPCFFDNIEWMNKNGITVYLNTDESLLFKRLSPQKHHRPLLKNLSSSELKAYIHNKLEERSIYYQQAKLIIPISFNDPLIAFKIAEQIKAIS